MSFCNAAFRPGSVFDRHGGAIFGRRQQVPLQTSVELTIAFPTGEHWLFFVTHDLLNRVGDGLNGDTAKVYPGELRMTVASELSPEVIDSVLRDLHQAGELERRTLAFSANAGN
jgi:hypothetical protein